MRVLLDTHIFIWAIMQDGRLSKRHRNIWLDSNVELYLSFASIWEMLIKIGNGKLSLPAPHAKFILRQMDENRVAWLGPRASHFNELELLPPLHRDPFDRMLIAQARAEHMQIASVDAQLRDYGVKFI